MEAKTIKACDHGGNNVLTLGEQYLWCEKCGAIQRKSIWANSQWCEPILLDAARELMIYLRENTGTSDEWPIEICTASDEGGKLAQLLNEFEQALT